MSLSTDFKEAVVIDNGSTLCKAGFAGYDGPNAVFVNKVGRPKNSYSGVIDTNLEHAVVGDETYPNRFYLSLTRPMEHGIVTHWNDMEKLWDYTFHEVLRVQPKEQPVLLTEVSLNSKVEKERMVEIMFEKFEVPAMNVANTTVLSLFCSGRTTGCVVDSGGGASRTACVFEGQILPQSVQRIEVDGCDLTDYLARLMEYRGFLFTTVPEMKIVKDMKEKLTYVSLDFDPTTTIHDLIFRMVQEFQSAARDSSAPRHCFSQPSPTKARQMVFTKPPT